MRIIPAFLIALPLAARGAPASGPVTFNRQIGPILYRNCASCHRPGEAAPFSLLSYADAVKKGKTIAKVTLAHVMPPWKAEPASFSYRDERRLTAEEIALIQAWVKGGMPEGNEAEKPQPPKFGSGWQLGEPDLVVEMPAAYHVPAESADIYRNIAAPLGLAEDKWVTAIDMRPSARTVVHQKMTATLPGGEVKTLLWIKDWDFAWQDRYFFQQFVPLPSGTRLDVEVHWDNSADNPRNPSNPPIRVTWGEESKDEMGSISLIAVPHEQSDLAALQGDIARRRNELVKERMRSDPSLAASVAKLLAE